jgi:hypothetical protein
MPFAIENAETSPVSAISQVQSKKRDTGAGLPKLFADFIPPLATTGVVDQILVAILMLAL